ncbi:hypothetical protein [Nocardia goodfellowii]|uniref:Uncharacterized protein n=1 Tax=Nocardia goodfellowii TaxID=882446 RepID=A0ABS4QAT0_9NOCA|nr:hypothetical protein [Nocardia goodfellowii]MBP2188805.1 hypothetical protein [Nocardia goodfellowii]
MVFGSGTDSALSRLIGVVRQSTAEAVFVPSAAHFEGTEISAELVRVCDVITVSPEATYARTLAAGIFPDPARRRDT